MSGNAYFLLMLGLLVAVGVLDLFRGRLVRGAGRRGRQWGESITARAREKHLPGIISTIDRTAVLHVEPARARELVAATIEGEKGVRSLGPDRWGMRYVRADDLVLELHAHPAGAEFLLLSIHEGAGEVPAGAYDWKALADKVRAAADVAGVSREAGHRPHTRGELTQHRVHLWPLAD